MPATSPDQDLCQTCGACCAYCRDWPRFTMEDDAQIERIPAELVDPGGARMASIGDRCLALCGDVGVSTSCTIYELRPDVCRACQPSDDACKMARAKAGL